MPLGMCSRKSRALAQPFCCSGRFGGAETPRCAGRVPPTYVDLRRHGCTATLPPPAAVRVLRLACLLRPVLQAPATKNGNTAAITKNDGPRKASGWVPAAFVGSSWRDASRLHHKRLGQRIMANLPSSPTRMLFVLNIWQPHRMRLMPLYHCYRQPAGAHQAHGACRGLSPLGLLGRRTSCAPLDVGCSAAPLQPILWHLTAHLPAVCQRRRARAASQQEVPLSRQCVGAAADRGHPVQIQAALHKMCTLCCCSCTHMPLATACSSEICVSSALCLLHPAVLKACDLCIPRPAAQLCRSSPSRPLCS